MTTAHTPTTDHAATSPRCPRCGVQMTTHERSGVVVDQCRECRGMFLDRGELERLIDAEGGVWLGPTGSPAMATIDHPTPAASAAAHGYHSEWYGGDDWRDRRAARRAEDTRPGERLRHGLLHELLDSFGD